MHYGFRIVEDLCDGLSNWMDEKGFKTIADVSATACIASPSSRPRLSYRAVARIDTEKCIKCNLCYVACNDTAHQCIDLVSPQGALVQPHAYDVRSNGKQQRLKRASAAVREEDCVAAVSAITYARWTIALKWLSFLRRSGVTWSELSQNQTKSPKTGRR